jgi:hypothetical protein
VEDGKDSPEKLMYLTVQRLQPLGLHSSIHLGLLARLRQSRIRLHATIAESRLLDIVLLRLLLDPLGTPMLPQRPSDLPPARLNPRLDPRSALHIRPQLLAQRESFLHATILACSEGVGEELLDEGDDGSSRSGCSGKGRAWLTEGEGGGEEWREEGGAEMMREGGEVGEDQGGEHVLTRGRSEPVGGGSGGEESVEEESRGFAHHFEAGASVRRALR